MSRMSRQREAALSWLLVLAAVLPFGAAYADGVFHLQTVRLAGPDAHVFLAPSGRRGTASVAVLQGFQLTFVSPFGSHTAKRLTLPEGVSAFDVADIDGDAAAELVCVRGREVATIDPGVANPEPQTRFEIDTLFASEHTPPFPHALVLNDGARQVLALPADGKVVFRTLSGAVAKPPPGAQAEAGVILFNTWEVQPPQAGGPSSLEVRMVERMGQALDAVPPGEGTENGEYVRRGTPSQMRMASEDEPESWPWFYLKPGEPESARVLYRVDQATHVRLREVRSQPGNGPGGVRLGPPRSYPGTIAVTDGGPPDFNNDGYADLVLWSTAEPGVSLHSAARAAFSRTWPLRLSAYLFSPEKQRYDPSAVGVIECRIPTAWFVVRESGEPMRRFVLGDFDGDGHTDCAFSTNGTSLSVWLFKNGFGREPDDVLVFEQPLTDLVLAEDLDNSGCVTLVLRSRNAVHILHPARKSAASR